MGLLLREGEGGEGEGGEGERKRKKGDRKEKGEGRERERVIPVLLFPQLEPSSLYIANVCRVGPFQQQNAEYIEQEVGDMFRTMYKLTKVFADQPGPRSVTDRLRSKIEKFRLHQPVLNVICNPGIRDRHWQQVGASVADYCECGCK